MVRTPFKVPQFQMQVSAPSSAIASSRIAHDEEAPSDTGISKTSVESSGMAAPTTWWNASVSNTLLSQQTYPPVSIHGVDGRKVLHNWADSYLDAFDPSEESWFGALAPTIKNDGTVLTPETPPNLEDDLILYPPKATALLKMRDVIAEAAGTSVQLDSRPNARLRRSKSTPLEMVGLIPKDFDPSFLTRGWSDIDECVLALGLFSRGQIEDDRRGSLRRTFEYQYAKQGRQPWWGRSETADATSTPLERQFEVFAIEGLVASASVTERSARFLLYKIEKYAYKESKLVVLPKSARVSSDGRDMTKYYVRLGFKRVEMEDGAHEYVYTGISSSGGDSKVEHQQIMVEMSLE